MSEEQAEYKIVVKRRGRPLGDPTPKQLEVRTGNTFRRFDKGIVRDKLSITLIPDNHITLRKLAASKGLTISQVLDRLVEEAAVGEFWKIVEQSTLSPLASRIHDLLKKHSYLAVWTIAEELVIQDAPNHCGSGEWTETDAAMKELLDKGLIEELPELKCRYRLVPQQDGE